MASRSIYDVTDAERLALRDQLDAFYDRVRAGSINPAEARKIAQMGVGWKVPFRAECIWDKPFDDFWPVRDGIVVRRGREFTRMFAIGGHWEAPQITTLHKGCNSDAFSIDEYRARYGYLPHDCGVIIIHRDHFELLTPHPHFVLTPDQVPPFSSLIGSSGDSLLFLRTKVNSFGEAIHVRSFVGKSSFDVDHPDSYFHRETTALFHVGIVAITRKPSKREKELVVYSSDCGPRPIYAGTIKEWDVAPDGQSVIVLDDGGAVYRCRINAEPEVLLRDTPLVQLRVMCNHPAKAAQWGRCLVPQIVATNEGAVVSVNRTEKPGLLIHCMTGGQKETWSKNFGLLDVLAVDKIQRPFLHQGSNLFLRNSFSTRMLHDDVRPNTRFLPTTEGVLIKRNKQLWHCMPRD